MTAAAFRLVALLLVQFVTGAIGHGRLLEPPSRGSMWRFGYNSPVNYADNQLFCGGFTRQWMKNGGRCGVCGDPYDGPRDHEVGGKFYTGQTTRTYEQGQIIKTEVELTAFHGGWFEFRLCRPDFKNQRPKQDCFDKHLLYSASGRGTRYTLPNDDSLRKVKLYVRLPRHVTCNQCILQWKYHAANLWGRDPSGRQCVGCGPQEEFYGCADVRILPPGSNVIDKLPTDEVTRNDGKSLDSHPEETNLVGQNDWPTVWKTGPNLYNKKPTYAKQQSKCRATGSWSGQRSMDDWCELNCPLGHCPTSHCTCSSESGSSQRRSSYKSQHSTTYPYTQSRSYSSRRKHYPYFSKETYVRRPTTVVTSSRRSRPLSGTNEEKYDTYRPYAMLLRPYSTSRGSYGHSSHHGNHYRRAQRDVASEEDRDKLVNYKDAFSNYRYLTEPLYKSVLEKSLERDSWPGVSSSMGITRYRPKTYSYSSSSSSRPSGQTWAIGNPHVRSYLGSRTASGTKSNFELYDNGQHDLIAKAKFVDDMSVGRLGVRLDNYYGEGKTSYGKGAGRKDTTKTCRAAGSWAGQAGMTSWCRTNCAVGNCPQSHCQCQ